MKLLVIGNKGNVGSATQKALITMGHDVVGIDRGDWQDLDVCQGAMPIVPIVCTREEDVFEVFHALHASDLGYGVVIIRSTVLPGTCGRLSKQHKVGVIHWPEFGKESSMLHDMFFAKRFLVGLDDSGLQFIVNDILDPFHCLIEFASTETTELVKLVTNAYAATVITFWNVIGSLCKRTGLSGNEVARLTALIDNRVTLYGTFTGGAFGGACLPKDFEHLMYHFTEACVDNQLLRTIWDVNAKYPLSEIVRGA